MKASISCALLFLVIISTNCNKDIGEVTLTYNKATAVYGDLDAIRATPLIGLNRAIEDPGKIFMGDEVLLIGEEGKGIHVFDNNNINDPVPVLFIDLPFTNEFYVQKDIIYAISHYDMVKIDISNMLAPTIIDRDMHAFSEPIVNNQGETLVGFDFGVVTESFELNGQEAQALLEESILYFDYRNNMIPKSTIPSSFAGNGTETDQGTTNRIALTDRYLYVVTDNSLLTFVDNPTELSVVDKQYLGEGVETIYLSNNQLFIGTQTAMIIMDISSEENPFLLSSYWHPMSCDPVLPSGPVAYVTLRSINQDGCTGEENSLTVVDISNVHNPNDLVIIPMNSPFGMCIQNNYLFVGEGANGISVFDIATPSSPVLEMSFPHEIYDIMPHPNAPNRFLAAGPEGLSQYEVDYTAQTMTLLSAITF